MYKIKIIGAKCELLISENKVIKFGDLYNMVFYIKKHKLKISNPEILPDSFRELMGN